MEAGREQVKFSPDGTRVAATSADGRLTVWNTTGKSKLAGFLDLF
jgi:WD40 repeat protein